jgi:hypothetical protein
MLQCQEEESVAALVAIEGVVQGLESVLEAARGGADRLLGQWVEGKELLEEQVRNEVE